MATPSSYSSSSSSSKTWEGIEGYEAKFVDRDKLNWAAPTAVSQKTIAAPGQAELANRYGFMYGDQIDQRYQDAVNAKYNELDNTLRKGRDTSLNDTAAGLDSYLQTLRSQRARQMNTGINRGINAASEVQAMMGSQQAMSDSQQAYADLINKTANERGTAAYEAQVQAMSDRNNVANQMGTLGMQQYGYDVQDNASYYSYLAQTDANRAAMNQSAAAWNATEGQNTRRQTSDSTSSSYSYDNSANINAAATAAATKANNDAASKYFDTQVSAYMNRGYSKSDAQILAGGGSLDGLKEKEKVTADLNSSAAPKIPTKNTTTQNNYPSAAGFYYDYTRQK